MGYGIVHDQIFDSTLRDKWQALVTFMCLLTLADEHDEVDMTVAAIAARTGLPPGVISEGIDFLEQPDKFSRSPGNEGRRIVRLDEHRPWGWHIPNRGTYKRLRSKEDRRVYFRDRKRTERASEHECPQPVHTESTPVHTCPPQAVGSRHKAVESRVKDSGPEPSQAKPAGPFTLPATAGESWTPTEAQVAAMRQAFPGVSLEAEFRRMRAWLMLNPARRKTQRGLPRFVNSWLAKEQDSGRSAKAVPDGW